MSRPAIANRVTNGRNLTISLWYRRRLLPGQASANDSPPTQSRSLTLGARQRSGGFRKITANRENPSVGVLQAEPRPLGSVRIGVTSVTYLITFACYGCRIHGSESGSVDRGHNVPGTPFLEEDSALAAFEGQRMDQSPYHLDQVRRDARIGGDSGGLCASWLESAGGPSAKQSRAYGGGGGGSAGANHERLQSLRQPTSESSQAG